MTSKAHSSHAERSPSASIAIDERRYVLGDPAKLRSGWTMVTDVSFWWFGTRTPGHTCLLGKLCWMFCNISRSCTHRDFLWWLFCFRHRWRHGSWGWSMAYRHEFKRMCWPFWLFLSGDRHWQRMLCSRSLPDGKDSDSQAAYTRFRCIIAAKGAMLELLWTTGNSFLQGKESEQAAFAVCKFKAFNNQYILAYTYQRGQSLCCLLSSMHLPNKNIQK